MGDWIETSLWIKYGKSWKQFCDDDLNKSGTEIGIRNGCFLIGDINENGGGCECCTHVEDQDIVTQYRVLEI